MFIKTSYRYLKNNSDWLMEQLGAGVAVSGPNLGQRINEPKDSILSTMFFVGSHTFDQVCMSVAKMYTLTLVIMSCIRFAIYIHIVWHSVKIYSPKEIYFRWRSEV